MNSGYTDMQLKGQKQKIVEMIKGTYWTNADAKSFWGSMDTVNPFSDLKYAHNQALDDILKKLEEL